MTEQAWRYVLIGSGVAAVAAAEAIRARDSRGEIIMVSDDPHGYYSRPGLAYYLTGEVKEDFLFPFQAQDFKRLGVQRQRGRVEVVDAPVRQVLLADGSRLRYDRLLIAVGAQAVLPPLPGSELSGVMKLDHLEDARGIIGAARRAKRAVVIGGGITALEIVEGLVSRKVQVHYLLRGERYWGNVLEENESRVIERRLKEEGVRLHYHTEAEEVLGKQGRVVGVRTKSGEVIQADLVAVAVGIKPRLELARRSGLAVGKGISVDDHQRAAAEDVYAAGDAAEVTDAQGRKVMNSLWAPARAQGWAAGANMAGGNVSYERSPAFNVTRLAGLTTTIIGQVGGGEDTDLVGIARGDSETWRQLPDAIAAQKGFEVNRLRVLIGEKALVGAVVMGDQTLSQALQTLVRDQVDISSVRARLLNAGNRLGDEIAAFWSEWRRNGSSQAL